MRCQSCGAVIDDNSAFCTVCGARQDPELKKAEQRYGSEPGDYGADAGAYGAYPFYPSGSSVGSVYAAVFREPLFLAITILMTVCAVLSLFSTRGTGLNVDFNMAAAIPILYAVALWLIYGEFRTDKAQYSTTGLAIASGTTKALYIITWVAVGLVAALVIVMILFGHLLVNYLTVPFIENLPDKYEFEPSPGVKYTIDKNTVKKVDFLSETE